MKYEQITLKMAPELLADLDAFAAEKFPMECPKCKAAGSIDTGPCPRCDASGYVPNRSEAIRFLLHYSLGQRAKPQARAMLAVYQNVAPKIVSAGTHAIHRMEKQMHQEIVSAIEAAGFAVPPPNTTPRKKAPHRRRKSRKQA